MCGINGYISRNDLSSDDLKSKIDRMNVQIRHRGPDDTGDYLNDRIALGHVRLSIIDLSELGHQPMHFENLIITFNGEIYNYIEIRQHLLTLGHTFISWSDTEVILHAFSEWGIACLDRLIGMFAFCIYDAAKGKAFLVRDRLGIKPIYYIQQGLAFAFSSELRSLENLPDFDLHINEEVIPSYLSLLYTPNNQSPFKEILKLPAGSYIELDTRTLNFEIREYWSLKNISPFYPSFENPWEHIRDIVIKAIEQRLVADVSVGLWLSGGVDSGLIAGIINREMGVQLETFSITYPQSYGLFDESERARIIANHFSHKHTELEIDPVKIFDDFDEILSYQEEWIGNPAALLYYQLSEKTVDYVKVALSGLGGDEVFGGYNRYRALEMTAKLNRLPQFLTKPASALTSFLPQSRLSRIGNYGRAINKIFTALDEDDYHSYARIISYLPSEKIETLVSMIEHTGDSMNDVMRFDIRNYMREDLLLLSDKMSMAHGLELRVPLIDYKIIESAFSTAATNRMGRAGKKEFLRNWFDSYMENKLPEGRKMGFSIPVEPFLLKMGRAELNKYFTQSSLPDLVAPELLQTTLDEFFAGGKDRVNEIYALLILAKWRLAHNK